MTYYKENNNITKPMRKMLSAHMVKYYVHNNIWIKRSEFEQVNSLIADEFPTERVSYYFRTNGKNPGGILYNKYKADLSKLRNLKLLRYKNTMAHEKEATRPPSTFILQPSSAEADDIEFLRLNSSPINLIEEKWKSTSRVRLNEFKSMEQIHQVTSKYPLLTNVKMNQFLVGIFIYKYI